MFKNSDTQQVITSEQSLGELVENAAIGIYRTNEDGQFLLANSRLAQILGFPSQSAFLEAVPNISALYLDPDERQSNLEKIKSGSPMFETEVRFKRPDGQQIWVNITCRTIKTATKGMVFEGFIVDITKRKQAEALLLDSEQRFRMLVEQAGDAFFIHDFDGHIIEANVQACLTLGYTREELLKMPIPMVDIEAHKKKHRKVFWDQLDHGQYVTFEGMHIRKDGSTFPVEVRLGRLDIGQKRMLLSLMRDITERKETEAKLKKAFDEIKALKEQLEKENIDLRKEIELTHKHKEILGESTAIRRALNQAEKVAGQDTCVLILGETGTGKELMAHAIHEMSRRKTHSMVKVNCAALPATLIESELFGREKGAFTGALTRRIGRFEAAHKSTIFLDEIGDLPMELQAKLLRVLQEGHFERLGSTKTITVDVRVIAATNRHLEKMVREGSFRKDLFYRLNVFPITVPPLRERREDIALLVWSFVNGFAKSMGKLVTKIDKKDMRRLTEYAWPGNVRELKNVIERAMIMSVDTRLPLDGFESKDASLPLDSSLADVEKSHIKRVLMANGWRVSGPKGAAKVLGLKPTTLEARMKKLGIKRPG
jgi:formate hydrogenlyase transcriptional activator